MLSQDWTSEVDWFICLSSCISLSCSLSKKSLHIQKAQLAFTNLRHLWRWRDIRLSIKDGVCIAPVTSVPLHGSESWQLRAKDYRRTSMFGHRCLLSYPEVLSRKVQPLGDTLDVS